MDAGFNSKTKIAKSVFTTDLIKWFRKKFAQKRDVLCSFSKYPKTLFLF